MKLFSNNIVEYKSTEGCKIYPIVVDIKKGFKSGELISFVTADNQVGVISVELIDGNSPYVIEGNLVTATIHRPDDSVLEMVCENVEGNIVTIELGVNGTFMAGVHTFDIKIHRGDDKIVGIPTMSYTVHKSLSSDGCIEEEDKLPIISNLTNEVIRLNGEWDAFTDKFGDIDWEEMQNMGANSVTVNGTKYTQVNGNIALPSYPTLSSLGAEPKNSNIQAHISSTHAPSNAQKNSDITKAEIEAKLIGNITTHTHNQYLTQHQDLSHLALKTELHNHNNKSVLDNITNAKVAEWNNKSTFSGNYNDLTNKPNIPTVTNDLTNTLKSNYDKAYTHSQTTHFNGDYNSLTNKPTIPSLKGYATEDYVKSAISQIDPTVEIKEKLPNYWVNYLNNLDNKIKTLQKENGMDTLQFLWCSDIHGVSGTAPNNTTYIGEIGRYMMDKHNIPFFVISGDIMSQASHAKEESMWNEYDKLTTMLSPIKNEEFLAIRGNHDGVYGSPMEYNGNANQYYHSYMGDKALFNAFMRRQTLDSHRRVFGKDGMYFYVEYHNYRIYMLNTHTFGDNSTNEQGQAIYNGFKHDVFGSEQLQWVADTLNTVKENQEVIFVGHVPLKATVDNEVFIAMINHYIGRSSGTSSKNITGAYWGTDEKYAKTIINVDFTNAKGSVVGWFNGHIHKDTIRTDLFDKLPMFSITTAGGDLRDEYLTNGTLTRVKGTPTETAIDLVTITSDYIYCTRIGSGYDRKYNRLTKEITIDYDSAYIPPTDGGGEDDGDNGDNSELTQGEITSEVTWKENTRLSSSSGNYSTQTGIYASSDIKVKNGDVIRIYGASDWLTYGYICAYSDSGFLSHVDMYGGTELSTNHFKVVRDSEQILTITILHSSVTYIRVCNKSLNPSTVRVFRNMELNINNLVIPNPTNTTDTSIWVNGYRFSSSGLAVQEGTSVSNKIQIKKGDTIKISGVTLRENQDRLCVNVITASGTDADVLSYFNLGSTIGGTKLMSYKGYADGVYTFFVENDYTGTINHFRFAMPTPTNFSKVKVIRE